MPRKDYYGIEKGRTTGVTDNWEMCKQQVDGYKYNSYKGFDNVTEAKEFAEGRHERSQGDTPYYGGKPYVSKK